MALHSVTPSHSGQADHQHSSCSYPFHYPLSQCNMQHANDYFSEKLITHFMEKKSIHNFVKEK